MIKKILLLLSAVIGVLYASSWQFFGQLPGPFCYVYTSFLPLFVMSYLFGFLTHKSDCVSKNSSIFFIVSSIFSLLTLLIV